MVDGESDKALMGHRVRKSDVVFLVAGFGAVERAEVELRLGSAEAFATESEAEREPEAPGSGREVAAVDETLDHLQVSLLNVPDQQRSLKSAVTAGGIKPLPKSKMKIEKDAAYGFGTGV